MNFSGITGHLKQKAFLDSIVQSGKIPHSLLFTGINGIGKKMTARRFLAGLFCRENDPPCFRCLSCLQIEHGTHPDYLEIGPGEKGSIPIGSEDRREPGSVRWLIDRLSRKALSGRFGVIIDGVHTITEEGQNALLKTIEEPAAGTTIILIGSHRAGILSTIISRSIELKFYPLGESQIREMLRVNELAEEEQDAIAILSGGSPMLAGQLKDTKYLDRITEAAAALKSTIIDGSLFRFDIENLVKSIGVDPLLDALINLYRHHLFADCISVIPAPPQLRRTHLDDAEKTRELLKILVALKKGQSHNLNFRIALKGKIYPMT